MKISLPLVLFSTLFSTTVLAHNVQLNQPLPKVSVSQDGELFAQGGKIQYRTWHSPQLVGKVRILFHLAGRSDVKEKNDALMNAIRQANFDRNHYQTTTIINADEAIVGTGIFVKNSAENGKLDHPHSQVILDQQSQVKQAWQLKSKESFVAVLDKQGNVQFVSEGKLSGTQIQQVITLAKQLQTH